jgi:hypothetical protein
MTSDRIPAALFRDVFDAFDRLIYEISSDGSESAASPAADIIIDQLENYKANTQKYESALRAGFDSTRAYSFIHTVLRRQPEMIEPMCAVYIFDIFRERRTPEREDLRLALDSLISSIQALNEAVRREVYISGLHYGLIANLGAVPGLATRIRQMAGEIECELGEINAAKNPGYGEIVAVRELIPLVTNPLSTRKNAVEPCTKFRTIHEFFEIFLQFDRTERKYRYFFAAASEGGEVGEYIEISGNSACSIVIHNDALTMTQDESDIAQFIHNLLFSNQRLDIWLAEPTTPAEMICKKMLAFILCARGWISE